MVNCDDLNGYNPQRRFIARSIRVNDDEWALEACQYLFRNKKLVDRIQSLDITLDRDVHIFAILHYLLAHADIKPIRYPTERKNRRVITEKSRLEYFAEVDDFFSRFTDKELKEAITEISGCYIGDYLDPTDFVEEDFEKRFPGVLEKLQKEGAMNYIDWEKVQSDTELEYVFVSIPIEFLPAIPDFKNNLCFIVTYVFGNHELQP